MAGNYQPITDWTGRETRIDRGYVLVWLPEHPKNFGGWYYEHRLVVEARLGVVLPSDHTVHHISEVKKDNQELNLFLCTRSEHDRAC